MRRLGNHDDTEVEEVAQRHLAHGLAVLLANLGEQRVLEEVVGALGERAPRHVRYAKVLHVLMRVVLLPEHMGLDLVDHRHHLGERADVEQARGVEVGNADRADEAVLVRTLHVAPRRVVIAVGLVKKHKVNLIHAKEFERLLDGVVGLALAVVGNPHLAHDEELVARNAARLDAGAHAALVAIRLSGVDHAVAARDGVLDAALGGGVVDLEHAVAEHGHLHAIGKGLVLHGNLLCATRAGTRSRRERMACASSIVLACHGYSRVYDDMPLYARCMLGTM